MTSFTVRPIGFVRSPFTEKVDAPRQAVAEGAEGVDGRIELLPEHEHALSDLEGFERIWILFWFHEAADAKKRSKVLPPRSDEKRGVFATRSPHRPNPIGMSAVRLVRVEGTTVHVRDLDLLDGTPVIDIKPYLSYADAFPEAKAGWLEPARDPRPSWDVSVLPHAAEQLAWIAAHGGLDLRERVVETLALGPQPHPYRRIKKKDDGTYVLAVKDWRIGFVIDDRVVRVQRVTTGYRDKELAKASPGTPQELHRAFVAAFG